MRRILASAFLAAGLLAGAIPGRAAGAGDPAASRVVIVANLDDPDSVAIARHYAAARGVPPENILAFAMPPVETITWSQFIATVWGPLQDELVARRWIIAAATGRADGVGRREYAISGHRMAALVVCRGVPLKIKNDAVRMATAPHAATEGRFGTNAGAVDSELSLLAVGGGYPIDSYVPNPLFGKSDPGPADRARVVEVARLDGPTAADANALVDGAIAAERSGLVGRAYVVMGGGVPLGNRWLGTVADEVRALGFDATIVPPPGGLAAGARADAPALYFGWHDSDLGGPFSLPGFRFPPGAIAMHIHSYSAATLRSAGSGWCGPLVARGAAATLGNVYEPYLHLTHRPDLFLAALAHGEDLADAAYYALPALSWQSILVGDPLYRPFALPLRVQLRELDTLPPALAGYPVLRLMHLLDAEGRPGDAILVARSALRERPGTLVVRMELAARLLRKGSPAEAGAVLAPVAKIGAFTTDQWALAHDATVLLRETGREREALSVYRHLFTAEAIPVELRAKWLVEAKDTALAAKDPGQAAAWAKELSEMEKRVSESSN